MALTKKEQSLAAAMKRLIKVANGDPVKMLLALAQVGVGTERLTRAADLACAECGHLAVPTCACRESPIAQRHGVEHEQRGLQLQALQLLTAEALSEDSGG